MEYRLLGSTDLSISRIGFGCWAIGGHGYGRVDDQESRNAVQKALDVGVNFFDTADVYGFGHSEEVLGSALGSERQAVVIATKVGVAWDENGRTYRDCSPKRIETALDASLRRLGIDCVPLYQIHWHDGKTPIADIMETLLRCRDKGKIRHIGCSNLPIDMVLDAHERGGLASLQMPYNLLHRSADDEIRRCSAELRMGVLTYGVLARGLLSGKYTTEVTFGVGDTRSSDPNFSGDAILKCQPLVQELHRIGDAYGKTPSQVAVRWVMDHPAVTTAIVGMKYVEQVRENIASSGWHLSSSDWEHLSEVGAKIGPP
jgi:aryl-alcohol dehydrogenase-like predicted oxidoreductase